MASHVQNEEAVSSLSQRKSSPSVVVVGAGISGIAAAHALFKRGIRDVTILEASSRPGGRIWSTSLGKQTVEMGAQFIHGVLDNPLFEIAHKNQLLDINLPKSPPQQMVCTDTGKFVSVRTAREISDMYAQFSGKCAMFFERRKKHKEFDSVGEFLENEILQYLSHYQDEERLLRRQLFENYLNMEMALCGCDTLHDLDLYQFGAYRELPGGNHTVPTGFSRFVDILLNDLPKEIVQFNMPVKKIIWELGPSVTVQCEGGKEFICDHVICTISLSCLKAHHMTMFSPELPTKKITSMQKLGMGTADRVFLVFDQPLVPTYIDETVTNISLLWSKSGKKSWLKKLTGFKVLGPSILQGWVSGKEAEHMEKMPEHDILEDCWDALKKCLNSSHFPKPVQVIRTDWHSNPFTQGAYSFIPIGASGTDNKNLAEPVYDKTSTVPLLLFAGEACHPAFYSTVHGALLSGKETAQTLIDLYLK